MENTVYLKETHEGWIINLLGDGIEVISPAVSELEVVQTCGNVVSIIEKPNVEMTLLKPERSGGLC